ncbi:MAG: MFS transporter [Lachnospiraceae bacterium]|nr:MFS transporter [Lachnospiraceae bacterium]
MANFINRLGDSAETIAYTYLLYKFTGSSAISALGLCVNFLPTVFLQPFAGGILEGKNPKKVMMTADVLRAVAIVALIVLHSYGMLKYYSFMLIMFIVSLVECFRIPAGMSVIPYICSEEEYETQASLNSAVNTVASVLGVMIGGIILERASFSMIFALDAMTYLISAVILGFLRMVNRESNCSVENDKKREKIGFTSFLLEGITILWKDEKLRGMVILALINNILATPYMAMEAPIVNGLLGDGSMLLSYMSIVTTLGMLLASGVYEGLSKIMGSSRVIFAGIASYAIEYFGLIVASNIKVIVVSRILVLSVMILCTLCQTLLSIYVNAAIIGTLPKDKIARGGAMLNSFISLAVPMGSGLISVALQLTNVKNILYIVAILTLVILVIILTCTRFKK